MKTCAKCGVSKPLTDFHVLNCRKDGRKSYCKVCIKTYSAARYKANPEHQLAVNAAWREKYPDRQKAANDAWCSKNKDRIKVVSAEWHRAHRGVWKKANPEKDKAHKLNYRKANPEKWPGYCAARLARKLNATPSWANKFFIEEAYALAQLRTKVLGFRWHVDHVVPLRSDLVSGLHVEANLQVIPWRDNLIKHNSRWPDMP